mmetsp:Transcript_68061/g.159602  ORF Transcript_68061/g.159602 Transcript_68061/m.159602 type:complete len:213 (+) Transcript_68061:850-1488(+)
MYHLKRYILLQLQGRKQLRQIPWKLAFLLEWSRFSLRLKRDLQEKQLGSAEANPVIVRELDAFRNVEHLAIVQDMPTSKVWTSHTEVPVITVDDAAQIGQDAQAVEHYGAVKIASNRNPLPLWQVVEQTACKNRIVRHVQKIRRCCILPSQILRVLCQQSTPFQGLGALPRQLTTLFRLRCGLLHYLCDEAASVIQRCFQHAAQTQLICFLP